MSEKDALRDRLEAELEAVMGRHERLRGHLRNKDRTVPADWSEMAQFLENDEVLEALEGRAREQIEALLAALHRVEEGTYTRCASCGREIAAERLELLPTTRVCASCAGA